MIPTAELDTPAFTLGAGTVTRESGGSRSVFRFVAPAKRHIEGGFSVSVAAVLFDAQGRFVARRSGSSDKTVLANRAAWEHEFEHDKLAAATTLVYDIEHRVDYRRKIIGGELPALPAESDGSDYWRWLSLDARALEDRLVKLDIGLWARNSSLEITYSQACKLVADSCRTEFELDLIDADQQILFAKTFSCSLSSGRPPFDDTSVSMDRKVLRSLRFFELRGRTECRAISQLSLPLR